MLVVILIGLILHHTAYHRILLHIIRLSAEYILETNYPPETDNPS